MIVADRLRRNMKITSTTSTTVIISVNFTSCTDSRIVTERSLRTSSVTDAGNCSRMAGSSALIRVHGLDDVHAGLLLHRQVDTAFTVLPARCLVVLDAVVDVRDFVQANGMPLR